MQFTAIRTLNIVKNSNTQSATVENKYQSRIQINLVLDVHTAIRNSLDT